MKKQMIVALVLLLLIPVVWMLEGLVFSLINPEIAAGHANYVRNFHILTLVRNMLALASAGVIGILWLLACFLVIRSKGRSLWWLFLAPLGPFGFAILVMLNDKAPSETDRHARFVGSLKGLARVGYEACTFVIVWFLAYEAMVLARNFIIFCASAASGMSTAQIVNVQNTSSGMWAFGEGIEVMFMVVLLYLVWPIVFNMVSRSAAATASPKAR